MDVSSILCNVRATKCVSCGETVEELSSCVLLCVCLCREADSSVADYGPLRGLSRQRPRPVGEWLALRARLLGSRLLHGRSGRKWPGASSLFAEDGDSEGAVDLRWALGRVSLWVLREGDTRRKGGRRGGRSCREAARPSLPPLSGLAGQGRRGAGLAQRS